MKQGTERKGRRLKALLPRFYTSTTSEPPAEITVDRDVTARYSGDERRRMSS